jgi:hypothetical protein
MFRYRLVDQRVPAMCLNLAAARLMAELPSGKAPTTRVRLRISRMMRSKIQRVFELHPDRLTGNSERGALADPKDGSEAVQPGQCALQIG